MARLSGSGSSIKIWLEKWVLDKLLINVLFMGQINGHRFARKGGQNLKLNWSHKEIEFVYEDIARKIQATPLTRGIALGGDRQHLFSLPKAKGKLKPNISCRDGHRSGPHLHGLNIDF